MIEFNKHINNVDLETVKTIEAHVYKDGFIPSKSWCAEIKVKGDSKSCILFYQYRTQKNLKEAISNGELGKNRIINFIRRTDKDK